MPWAETVYLGAAPSRIGELGALHPSRLEPWYRVDGVEETQEPNPLDWATEGFAKPLHELVHLVAFFATLGRLIMVAALPVRKRFPGEDDHLFVPMGKQSDVIDHLS